MSDAPYNPSEPLFLLSRSVDERLTEDEQRRLNEALNASAALRQEAEAMRKVAGLIGRWSKEPVELDWRHHAALIASRTDADDEDELGRMDALLQRWGARMPAYDADTLTARVMAGIQSRAPRRTRSSLIFRLAAPLSAAAAIALVVTGLRWFQADVRSVAIIQYGMPVRAARTGESDANVTISFRRTPPSADAVAVAAPGFSFISVGATDLPVPAKEIPPL